MLDEKRPAQLKLRLLRNARREAVMVLVVWAVFLAWVVGYSCLEGYALPAEGYRGVAGIPRWAFYGIALPWLVATALTVFFGAAILKDDDLGAEKDDDRIDGRD